jgi:predicted permease
VVVFVEVNLPQQPFRDELSDRRRTMLLLFYLTALFSVIAVSLADKIPSLRTFLFVLAVAGAGTAILFLLRFLRANDEHERQINYRALTLAFVGTLAFCCLSDSSRVSAFVLSPGSAFPR